MTKICTKCNIQKSLDDFYNDKRGYLGKYASCKSCHRFNTKQWEHNNAMQRVEYQKHWYQVNKKRRNLQQNSYIQHRKSTDFCFKLICNLRTRLYDAIKGDYKSGSAIRDLGCYIPELKQYFESLFQPGMSWQNYGQWHIDHIKPLSSFDLTNPNDFKKACHYSNLQPLWANENLKKGAKIAA